MNAAYNWIEWCQRAEIDRALPCLWPPRPDIDEVVDVISDVLVHDLDAVLQLIACTTIL